MKDKAQVMTAERRYFEGVTLRADEDRGVVEGVASTVGQEYDMGWYREKIMPGAFDEVLGNDVRVLLNHDPNLILGRTKSKTAEIFLNADGHLAYRYTTPDRTYAKDLEDAIRSGDIDQSSFGFMIAKQTWIEEMRDGKLVDIRQIDKIHKLYDVSPVTFPANPNTDVGKRAWEMRLAEKEKQKEEERNAEGGLHAEKREARLREAYLEIHKP